MAAQAAANCDRIAKYQAAYRAAKRLSKATTKQHIKAG